MEKSAAGLSPQERVIYYRDMAAESVRLAEAKSDPRIKANLLDNAARWNALANIVERRADR
jgi:hypothetical protein